MAQALKYDVPPAPTGVTKEEELAELLQTLHDTGALRVLIGFVGGFQDIMEVVLEELNTEGGRRVLSNLLIAAGGLTDLDSDRFSVMVRSVSDGLGEAAAVLQDEPPTRIRLLRMMNDPDTRRGLYAGLTLLQAVGRRAHVAQSRDSNA